MCILNTTHAVHRKRNSHRHQFLEPLWNSESSSIQCVANFSQSNGNDIFMIYLGRNFGMKRLIDLPFFGLSELPAFETRIYDDGNVRIEVQPGPRGLATIWDKKILDYAFQMMRATEGKFGSKISLRPDDFFASCIFSPLDQSAQGLGDALDRLRSTSIRASVENELGERERLSFSWINGASMQTREEGVTPVVELIEVELVDWTWRSIFESDDTFQTSLTAFSVTSGISWRVNDLANRQIGDEESWSTSLDDLGKSLGYLEVEQQIFSQHFHNIMVTNNLPNFNISVRRKFANDEYYIDRLPIWEENDKITATFTKRRRK